jgi:hypothetical protein
MPDPAKPSASIVAAGIVAIVGSVLLALCGLLALAGMFLAPANPDAPQIPAFARASAGFGAVLLLGLCVFGIFCGVGLLKLRRWARLATLIFAGLLVVMTTFGVIVVSVISLPPNITPEMAPVVRAVLVFIYGVPLVVGVWWLVLFNRAPIVAQFATGEPAKPGRCPFPVAVIAGFYLFSACSIFLLPFLHFRIPVIAFGRAIHGPLATILLGISYVVLVAGSIGLLKVKRWSYPLMIGYQFFWLVGGAVNLLVPNHAALFREALAIMEIPDSPYSSQDYSRHYMLFSVAGLFFAVVILGILIYYRKRFLEAAAGAERQS